MANQIQVTVYAINGAPVQGTPLTLAFPTKEIFINEATSSTIAQVTSKLTYFPNPNNITQTQEFLISETVATCLTDANTSGTSMIEATIRQVGEYPLPAAVTYLFPADKPSIWANVDGSINSYIQFKGQKYYAEETESTLVTAANAGDGGSSYLVYTALLTQSGTDAPVATVLENTLGGTVVWSYSAEGVYLGTLLGAFPTQLKVYIAPINNFSAATAYIYASWENANSIKVQTYEDGVAANAWLFETPIEIRVYP